MSHLFAAIKFVEILQYAYISLWDGISRVHKTLATDICRINFIRSDFLDANHKQKDQSGKTFFSEKVILKNLKQQIYHSPIFKYLKILLKASSFVQIF